MKHPAEKAVYHRALTFIVQEAHRRLDEMEAQNLVSLGYAIVIFELRGAGFPCLEHYRNAWRKVCGRANAQDLSNAVWATAKVGGGNSDQTGARTFFIVEEEVLRRGAARLENPQNISNTAWASRRPAKARMACGLYSPMPQRDACRSSRPRTAPIPYTRLRWPSEKDHHAF